MVARSSSSRAFGDGAAENDGAFTPLDWGLFASVALIWGSSFLFIAIGLGAFEPGLITFLRIGLGAAALAVVPRSRCEIDRADRPRIVALSLVWVAIPFTLFPLAQQHINSSVTGLLNGATPIFVALVATIVVKRRPGPSQLVGIAVGFVGVVFISAPSIDEGSSEALGVALVLAATVSYGFAINLAAPLQRQYGAVPIMARILRLATIWTLPLGLWGLAGSSFQWGSLVATVVLGVVGTGVAFAIMATLVGRVGATRASFITYLIPVVALALGVWFRDDEVAGLALVGCGLVSIGAVLASRRDTGAA